MMQVDQDTNDLLRSLNMVNLPGVKMVAVSFMCHFVVALHDALGFV